jgi:hypothetical protein
VLPFPKDISTEQRAAIVEAAQRGLAWKAARAERHRLEAEAEAEARGRRTEPRMPIGVDVEGRAVHRPSGVVSEYNPFKDM